MASINNLIMIKVNMEIVIEVHPSIYFYATKFCNFFANSIFVQIKEMIKKFHSKFVHYKSNLYYHIFCSTPFSGFKDYKVQSYIYEIRSKNKLIFSKNSLNKSCSSFTDDFVDIKMSRTEFV